MIVRLLRKAEADLRSIGEYIARNNPERAATFIAELSAKVDALSTMAESFPFAGLSKHPDVRRRLHGRYGIYYSVDASASRVDVYRVLHSAQNIAQVFNS